MVRSPGPALLAVATESSYVVFYSSSLAFFVEPQSRNWRLANSTDSIDVNKGKFLRSFTLPHLASVHVTVGIQCDAVEPVDKCVA